MTPAIAFALLLLVVCSALLYLSGAKLLGIRVRRFSQRPTFRAPNIPVEFERGEWEIIPEGRRS